MKALRENQLISIVLGDQIRRGRIRRINQSQSPFVLDVVLDVRGRHFDLAILAPETEGIRWARGWNTEAAKALGVAHALAPPTPPGLGEAGKKLLSAFGKALVERPTEVIAAIGKALDILTKPKAKP
jgi:hypothetical protein